MKKFIFIFCLIFLAIFLARNFIAEKVLVYYFRSRFKVESSFEKISLNINQVKAEKIEFLAADYRFLAKGIRLGFNLAALDGLENYNLEVEKGFFSSPEADVEFKIIPGQTHRLYLKKLKLGNKKLKGLNLRFFGKENKIFFDNFYADFLNPESKIFAFFEFNDFSSFCAEVAFNQVNSKNIIKQLLESKEEFIKGFFSGQLNFCFSKTKLTHIDARLNSFSRGLINIKKKSWLPEGEKYLKTSGYDISESFKDYEYDQGTILLRQRGTTLVLEINFDSQSHGLRNIVISLHDLLSK